MAFPQFEVLSTATPIDITQAMTGSSADDAFKLTITDAIALAAEAYCRGIYVNYTNSGAKSANADCSGIGVDINSTAACTSVWGVNVYTGACAAGTVNRLAAFTCYMDAVTGTVTQKTGIFLYIDAVGATTTDFIELRKAGATTADSLIRVIGGICSNYVLRFEQAALPVVATAGTYSTADGYLQIYIGSTAYRLPYFAAVD